MQKDKWLTVTKKTVRLWYSLKCCIGKKKDIFDALPTKLIDTFLNPAALVLSRVTELTLFFTQPSSLHQSPNSFSATRWHVWFSSSQDDAKSVWWRGKVKPTYLETPSVSGSPMTSRDVSGFNLSHFSHTCIGSVLCISWCGKKRELQSLMESFHCAWFTYFKSHGNVQQCRSRRRLEALAHLFTTSLCGSTNGL